MLRTTTSYLRVDGATAYKIGLYAAHDQRPLVEESVPRARTHETSRQAPLCKASEYSLVPRGQSHPLPGLRRLAIGLDMSTDVRSIEMPYQWRCIIRPLARKDRFNKEVPKGPPRANEALQPCELIEALTSQKFHSA